MAAMPALRGLAGRLPTFLSARKPPRNANFVTYSWFPPNHSLQQRGCAFPSVALRVQECAPEFRTFGTVISALLITNKSLVRVSIHAHNIFLRPIMLLQQIILIDCILSPMLSEYIIVDIRWMTSKWSIIVQAVE
jgi:hypothetical protein